eukprot:4696745-Pleurochrysis_carterae.AAC.2
MTPASSLRRYSARHAAAAREACPSRTTSTPEAQRAAPAGRHSSTAAEQLSAIHAPAPSERAEESTPMLCCRRRALQHAVRKRRAFGLWEQSVLPPCPSRCARAGAGVRPSNTTEATNCAAATVLSGWRTAKSRCPGRMRGSVSSSAIALRRPPLRGGATCRNICASFAK